MESHADLQVANVVNTDKPDQLRAQLSPLLILTSIFFINFISRIILSPLMPKIEVELGIAHAAAGSFFLLISIGYFITLLSSGFFSSRLTHRKTIILSAAVLGITLLGTSFSSGLWGIRIGMLIIGMAAGLEGDTEGLGAVGAYRSLSSFTKLGCVFTVFALTGN